MIVDFDANFNKKLNNFKFNKVVNKKVIQTIELFEKASNLRDISNIKKLTGHESFYRYKFGNYRIGFELINNETVLFIDIDIRSKFYRKFP